MKSKFSGLICILFLFIDTESVAQFVNGDFQTSPAYGCNAGPSWSFDSNTSNYPEITDAFQSGNWWIDLTPCGNFGNGTWIEQVVTTIPGQCYTVTMDIGTCCCWDGSDSGLYLTADGVAVGDRIYNDVFVCIAGTLGWDTFTSDVFVATGTTTTLRFTGEGRCSSISDPNLCAPLGGIGNPGVIALDNIVLNVLSTQALAVNQFPDETKCAGTSLVLGESVNGATYEWNTGATTAQITVQNPGTYFVEVATSCATVIDTIVVTDVLSPQPIDLGPDKFFCSAFADTLTAGDIPVNWSTQEIAPFIVVDQPGTYTATLSNNCGVVSDEILIEQFILPESLETNDVILCQGQSSVLEVPFADAVWSNGVIDSMLIVDQPGFYTANYSNLCGEVVYRFNVEEDFCDYVFYAPNTFTPDNDGINDTWHPTLDGKVDKFEISVWNRWGDKVWQSNTTDIHWTGQKGDGNFYVPDGIYQYQAVVTLNSEVTRYKGHVMLMR